MLTKHGRMAKDNDDNDGMGTSKDNHEFIVHKWIRSKEESRINNGEFSGPCMSPIAKDATFMECLSR